MPPSEPAAIVEAVVGVFSTDDKFLVGLAQQVEVAVDKFYLGVVRLGSRVGKKDVVESCRADLTQGAGQFDRGLVGALKKIVVERQLVELCRDRFLDAVLAVTQIAAPQARHAVLNLVTV